MPGRDDRLFPWALYYDENTGNYEKGLKKGSAEAAEELGISLAKELQERSKGTCKGKVWLVGAGPGDIGLFILKGMEICSRQRVVVYDSLVGQGVLSQIPKTARCINVQVRHRTIPYSQSRLMRFHSCAKKRYRVVRRQRWRPLPFWQRRGRAGAVNSGRYSL